MAASTATVYVALRAVSGVFTQGGGFTNNTAAEDVKRWLPRQNEAIVTADGYVNPRWYSFFFELSRRLGGVNGPSMNDVQTNVVAAQQAVTQTVQTTTEVIAAVNANASVLDANTQTAVAANLPGATQIRGAKRVLE